MPFFLPGSLISFEYLSSDPDPEYARVAEPYRNDMDFAFFAVNFGYSKNDYELLTPKERAFLYKAWEDRTVLQTTFLYNAVFTATYNVNRPKRKRALKLWRKARTQKADMDTIIDNIAIVEEVEKTEGKSWIDRIYQKNGLKIPRREEKHG